MRYRPTPALMLPWQTAHVRSTRESADFTALVVLASTNRVDTLPSLDVLMVAGAENGRRARGRVAVGGAPRGEGRQRGQHHAHDCGAQGHRLQRRGCFRFHRLTSGERL